MMLYSKFPHRINRDGSYDSICPVCHLTVANTTDEDELLRYERKHICSPFRLFEFSPSEGNV
jgi:hypothetical protein